VGPRFEDFTPSAEASSSATAIESDDIVAAPVEADRFYNDDYRKTLLSIGCALVDEAGPITLKHLCDRIARQHGFRKTGSKILRTISGVMQRARVISREPDGSEVYWPNGVDISNSIPFRGMEVKGVRRGWADLPYPEKLGLACEVLSQSNADPALAMSRRLQLSRLRANTRQEIEAVISHAQEDRRSLEQAGERTTRENTEA